MNDNTTTSFSQHWLVLFFATFVSTFLLATGIIIAVITIVPAIPHLSFFQDSYHPQLPLSGDRTGTDDIITINSLPAKQLYPSLSSIDNQAPGNWIRIPSIGVAVPLASSPSLEDTDIIATLSSGAALYPNGVLPGHLGNTFIAAHSTGEPWKGAYRFAFLRINELKPGNIIHLDYNGTRYTYKVSKSEIVTPRDDLRITSDRPVPTMTLMACWPLWSTQKRMLVHAELQNITQLTAQTQVALNS